MSIKSLGFISQRANRQHLEKATTHKETLLKETGQTFCLLHLIALSGSLLHVVFCSNSGSKRTSFALARLTTILFRWLQNLKKKKVQCCLAKTEVITSQLGHPHSRTHLTSQGEVN